MIYAVGVYKLPLLRFFLMDCCGKKKPKEMDQESDPWVVGGLGNRPTETPKTGAARCLDIGGWIHTSENIFGFSIIQYGTWRGGCNPDGLVGNPVGEKFPTLFVNFEGDVAVFFLWFVLISHGNLAGNPLVHDESGSCTLYNLSDCKEAWLENLLKTH